MGTRGYQSVSLPDDSSEHLPRVERKKLQRIQLILDTTADVLGEHGATNFSLEMVAEILDVTKGSLYHYFPSKTELMIKGVEVLAGRILADLSNEVDQIDGTYTDKLHRLLLKHISLAVRKYPAGPELSMMNDPPEIAKRVKTFRIEYNKLIRDLIEKGVQQGEFTVISIDTSLECIYSASNMAPMWINRSDQAASERKIAELVDTLLMLVGVHRS